VPRQSSSYFLISLFAIFFSPPCHARIKNSVYPATFIKNCAECHSYSTNDPTPAQHRYPPDIPFKKESLFQSWLRLERNKKEIIRRVFHADETERMPRIGQLSENEKSAIEKYINRN
jgi:hypothetical protein